VSFLTSVGGFDARAGVPSWRIVGSPLKAIALAIAVAACLARAGSANAAAISYCESYPRMDNVPRGSMIAASNHLCVGKKGGRERHYYQAEDAINPPHSIRIAARLHVALRYNGHLVAKSREYVTPRTPVLISTRWVRHISGKFCAVLWNHDSLGSYKVERHCAII
jgi:hypothetical protein